MKIGINLIQYTDVQGIEVFAKNLLLSLLNNDLNNEYIFFVNQESAKIFNFKKDNLKIIVKKFKKLTRLRLISYQQFGLTKTIKKEGINLLYCPSAAAPIFYKKKIITIHDCAYLRFKDEAGLISRVYLWLISLSAKYFSLRIITVSNFAKQEIMNLLKISAEKITVIFEGVPSMPEIDSETLAVTLNKYNLLDKKYFFFIGNLRPRKNIKRLLEAWVDFCVDYKDYYLVIAGKNDEAMVERLLKEYDLKNNLVFLGVVSEVGKTALYKGAIALVFPSLYEGFGLPVLEAQSLGIPVLTSNMSSLPEVAGNGALFVDPYDVKLISLGMKEIINPDFFKKDLVNSAYKNLERFSWDKSSSLLLEVINSLTL